MKQIAKLVLLSLVLLVAALPALTQGPGEGGIIIRPNVGGDPNFMNPLLANSTTELDVNQFMFPALYVTDPDTLLPATSDVRNDEFYGLATSWEVSEDGLTYTFHLRDDAKWSDGTPITAEDYKFTFDALASGDVSSPRTSVLQTIDRVEAPDPQTVVIHLKNASCRAISEFDDFGILPAHAIRAIIGDDWSMINTMDYNKAPSVTSGVFMFSALNPGEQVALAADPNHYKPVMPAGYIYKNVPDQTVAYEQFLAGEVNTITNVAFERFQELRDMAAAGEIQYYEYVDDGYTWMAFNLADPQNPVNGLDEEGNPVDQGHHPLFGDVRVRRAIAMAVNMDDIIAGAVSGEGFPAVTHASQTAWAYNKDIEPYPYDPEQALALLAEAGWVDDDNDPSTPLVATEEALYAEPGTPFVFNLQTDAGNNARIATATIIQDQLGKIGMQVNFETVEFQSLIPILLGQQYDAIILGWTNLPTDTDGRSQFNPEFDLVGSGFNFVSYNNPDVARLYEEARTLPGCDTAERTRLYGEVQQILHDELPYLFIYAPKSMVAASADVENFDPRAENEFYNIGDWVAFSG